MPGRGIQAYKEQAAATSERRNSGFANIMLLNAGESVRGRFRGLFYKPAWVYDGYENGGSYKTRAEAATAIEQIPNEWLAYFAMVLGMPVQDSIEKWKQAFWLRYKQIEPFLYQAHYVARLKGKDAHPTCSHAWDGKPCVACYLKTSGDKAISTRSVNAFSFHPRRRFHKLERQGQKAEYPFCAAVDGEYCVHCAQGNQAKDESVRYFAFADTHAGGLVGCVERIRKRCSACGVGNIRGTGWQCSNPECGEPFSGYQPPNPPPEGWDSRLICPECKSKATPAEVLTCTKGCEFPRRCQMHEVDVIVSRTGTGKNNTSYQFAEQFPAEPLPADLLAMLLPGFEIALKPKSIDDQCRILGLTQDPFTNRTISAPPQEQTSGYEEEQTAGDPYGETGAQQQQASGNGEDDIPF